MKFYTFYTDNLPQQLIQDHKNVCDKIGINVEYCVEPYKDDYDFLYTAHGNFMTNIMQQKDVACFLDIDCLPHNFEIIEKAYNWSINNESFVGNAQNISHTSFRNNIYAAASFLIITKQAWNSLGSPSFSWFIQNDTQIDTAQILTLRANQIGMDYQLLYPIGYDGPKSYKLSGYGIYGTGTLYPATWHYFRISQFKTTIPELWNQRVNQILNNQTIIPKHSSCYYGL